MATVLEGGGLVEELEGPSDAPAAPECRLGLEREAGPPPALLALLLAVLLLPRLLLAEAALLSVAAPVATPSLRLAGMTMELTPEPWPFFRDCRMWA